MCSTTGFDRVDHLEAHMTLQALQGERLCALIIPLPVSLVLHLICNPSVIKRLLCLLNQSLKHLLWGFQSLFTQISIDSSQQPTINSFYSRRQLGCCSLFSYLALDTNTIRQLPVWHEPNKEGCNACTRKQYCTCRLAENRQQWVNFK